MVYSINFKTKEVYWYLIKAKCCLWRLYPIWGMWLSWSERWRKYHLIFQLSLSLQIILWFCSTYFLLPSISFLIASRIKLRFSLTFEPFNLYFITNVFHRSSNFPRCFFLKTKRTQFLCTFHTSLNYQRLAIQKKSFCGRWSITPINFWL